MFQQFYEAGAEGYDTLFGRVPRHFAAAILRAAQLAPGQHVLDVAAGTGLVTRTIAKAVGESGTVAAKASNPADATIYAAHRLRARA